MRWSVIVAFLCFQSLAIGLVAQDYTYFGKIKDAANGEAIPFAHFQILPAGQTGFVADLNGAFTHSSNKQKLEVLVTAIGYEPLRTVLAPDKSNKIRLKSASLVLSEVVVTYVDEERELLQKVLDNISRNYPEQMERIKGKVIEQITLDPSFDDRIYSAEATIEADKLDYSKRQKYGTVRIIDGDIEYQSALDSLFVGIYAGVHNVHRFDVVAARMVPFDNIESKKYRFKLVDTLSYRGGALLKMHFESPVYTGSLFIQDSSYALVRAEYSVNNNRLKDFGSGDLYERTFLDFTVEYFKDDSLFRINYINYQSGFTSSNDNIYRNKHDRIFLNNFFYLDDHKPTFELIPFKDQTNFSDVLVQQLIDDEDERILADSLELKARGFYSRQKADHILKNISLDAGVSLFIYQPESDLSTIGEIGIDAQIDDRLSQFMLYVKFNYQINNNFGIGFATAGSSDDNRKVASHSVLMTFTHPLTKNRRWLGEIHSGFNYLINKNEIGEGLASANFIQQNELVSESVNITEQSRQINFLMGLQLRYRADDRVYIFLNGYLPLNVHNKLEVEAVQNDIHVPLYDENIRGSFRPYYYHYSLGLQLRL